LQNGFPKSISFAVIKYGGLVHHSISCPLGHFLLVFLSLISISAPYCTNLSIPNATSRASSASFLFLTSLRRSTEYSTSRTSWDLRGLIISQQWSVLSYLF